MSEGFPEENAQKEEAEKRRKLRVPLRVLRVEAQDDVEVFFGYASNVSTTGMFIETPNPKPVGFKAAVAFELPGIKKKISCTAEVVWNRNYQGQEGLTPGMGLEFRDTTDETDTLLHEFVEENS